MKGKTAWRDRCDFDKVAWNSSVDRLRQPAEGVKELHGPHFSTRNTGEEMEDEVPGGHRFLFFYRAWWRTCPACIADAEHIEHAIAREWTSAIRTIPRSRSFCGRRSSSAWHR